MVSYDHVLLCMWSSYRVLILIVVEDDLVQEKLAMIVPKPTSLNPYCSGRWSRTAIFGWLQVGRRVLILIVVENGLVHQKKHKQTHNQGLNPYCSGRWSRT